MLTILACPSCGTKNRVGAVPRGTPRCASCKAPLPWVVPAAESSFAAESEASVPVLVDFWATCGGREVDRVVGAVPKAQLEQRLAAQPS